MNNNKNAYIPPKADSPGILSYPMLKTAWKDYCYLFFDFSWYIELPNVKDCLEGSLSLNIG